MKRVLIWSASMHPLLPLVLSVLAPLCGIVAATRSEGSQGLFAGTAPACTSRLVALLPHFGMKDWLPWFHGVTNADRVQALLPSMAVCAGILVLVVLYLVTDSGKSSPTDAPGNGLGEPLSTRRGKAGVLAVVLLTSYRFYSGFLGATWGSFLVAKEGEVMAKDSQALWMAGSQIIFGVIYFSIPVLGFVNDRMNLSAPWFGRAGFLLTGMTTEALGTMMCMSASGNEGEWVKYILGCMVWILGATISDVTTEAVVPEYLEPDQFQFASSAKTLQFVFGSMSGVVAIVYNKDMDNYDWLYLANLMHMLTFGFAAAAVMKLRTPVAEFGNRVRGMTFWDAAFDSYAKPLRYSKAFNVMCLAVTLSCAGQGPIFFLLLIVRDVVEVQDATKQQEVFGKSYLVFLAGAAVSSVLSGFSKDFDAEVAAPDGARNPQDDGTDMAHGGVAPAGAAAGQPKDAMMDSCHLQIGAAVFAATMMLFPALCLVSVLDDLRIKAGYVLCLAAGLAFGFVYSKYQTILWLVLPRDADFGNAMGFVALCKVVGIGLGNLVVGLALDYFGKTGTGSTHTALRARHHLIVDAGFGTTEKVPITGHVVACVLSTAFCLSGMMVMRMAPLKRFR